MLDKSNNTISADQWSQLTVLYFFRTYYNPEIIKDNGHLLNLVVKQTNSVIETAFELTALNQFDQVSLWLMRDVSVPQDILSLSPSTFASTWLWVKNGSDRVNCVTQEDFIRTILKGLMHYPLLTGHYTSNLWAFCKTNMHPVAEMTLST